MILKARTAFFIVALISACMQLAAQAPTVQVTQQVAAPEILDRLEEPNSMVTIVAPESLMRRAARLTESQIQETVDEEVSEDNESEAPVRQRAGKVVGYRVQVYADNNVRNAKIEARHRERAISTAFPDYGTYVAYASPYWRLRVGDFRSQYEAEKAAAEIRKAFPSYAREVRVVRDRVNARQ